MTRHTTIQVSSQTSSNKLNKSASESSLTTKRQNTFKICIDWYCGYTLCGHVIFQKRQRCNDYVFHGSCSVDHHEEYLTKLAFCPPCDYYRRRATTNTDKSTK